MVLRRPIISPILPTPNDEIKAPTSRIATMVPISARLGVWKYSLKNTPLTIDRNLSALYAGETLISSYVIIPDITPWSYPNKNTPKETNTLVKYLQVISNNLRSSDKI